MGEYTGVMIAMTFDTLKFANRLKAAGMEPRLAEAQAQAIVELVDDTNVATKADIDRLSSATKADIDRLGSATKAHIDRLSGRVDVLEASMDGRFRLLYWMVGTLTALNAVIAGKLFI